MNYIMVSIYIYIYIKHVANLLDHVQNDKKWKCDFHKQEHLAWSKTSSFFSGISPKLDPLGTKVVVWQTDAVTDIKVC